MYLRRYVIETFEAHESLSFEDRQLVDPLSEATGKYIMIRYGINDVNLIFERLYHGHQQATKMVREYEDRFDRRDF